MHSWLVRNILYPLHENIAGRLTFTLLKFLEQSQWHDVSALRKLQTTKLSRLIREIAGRSPYYASLFHDLNIDPAHEMKHGSLERLPMSDKAMIRREFLPTAKSPHRGSRLLSTGGSTGEPLRFRIDAMRGAFDKAARMRTHLWFGVRPGEREAYLWGAPINNRRQNRLLGVRDWLLNDMLLSAFDLSETTMRSYLRRLESFDPVCLFGYPSSLDTLCEFARANSYQRPGRSLKAVFVTGEVLDDRQRRSIADYFNVPVANGYGGRDFGFSAHECPSGRMHITSEHVIFEIVDDQGRVVPKGECGEIVVTNLDNLSTPFLRYRTGDVGQLVDGTCPCGRGLEVMEIVGGRKTDHLVHTDGTKRHALSLIYTMRDTAGVERFQITQRSDLSMDIKLIAPTGLTEQARKIILRGVADCVGECVPVRIHKVNDIKPQPSGKFRYVISEAADTGSNAGRKVAHSYRSPQPC